MLAVHQRMGRPSSASNRFRSASCRSACAATAIRALIPRARHRARHRRERHHRRFIRWSRWSALVARKFYAVLLGVRGTPCRDRHLRGPCLFGGATRRRLASARLARRAARLGAGDAPRVTLAAIGIGTGLVGALTGAYSVDAVRHRTARPRHLHGRGRDVRRCHHRRRISTGAPRHASRSNRGAQGGLKGNLLPFSRSLTNPVSSCPWRPEREAGSLFIRTKQPRHALRTTAPSARLPAAGSRAP